MYIIFIISTLLSFLVILLTVGLDCFYQVYLMFCRKGIGQWKSIEEWKLAIFKRTEKWSEKMPKVSSTDNFRYNILNILQGKYSNNAIQSWQQAMVDYSLLDYYLDKDYINANKIIIKKYIDENGQWKIKINEIDNALLAYVILKYSSDKMKIKNAMDEMWQVILKRKSDKDGLICYRLDSSNLRFVDTIGLVCPFLTLYAKEYKNIEAENLANTLIELYLEKGFINNEYIPSHAYEINYNLPQGIIGWGRGLAWFLLGIIERYKSLENKEKIKILILQIAENIKKYQHKNGSVGWIITQEQSYDSSITAMYAYFYAVCYQMTLNDHYKEISCRALNALKQATRKNGAIDYSQGDTKGLGMYSSSFDILPFTQGIALLAINELDKGTKDESNF